MLAYILQQDQSATSLKTLLRDHLGFVWKYGLGLRKPRMGFETLTLDGIESGTLFHSIVERCVRRIEIEHGLVNATPGIISGAIEQATHEVKTEWEAERGVPPKLIWLKTLDDTKALGQKMIEEKDAAWPGQRTFLEVPLGETGAVEPDHTQWPWNPMAKVTIPGAGFNIRGRIDRLDLSADGAKVRAMNAWQAFLLDAVLKHHVRKHPAHDLRRILA